MLRYNTFIIILKKTGMHLACQCQKYQCRCFTNYIHHESFNLTNRVALCLSRYSFQWKCKVYWGWFGCSAILSCLKVTIFNSSWFARGKIIKKMIQCLQNSNKFKVTILYKDTCVLLFLQSTCKKPHVSFCTYWLKLSVVTNFRKFLIIAICWNIFNSPCKKI